TTEMASRANVPRQIDKGLVALAACVLRAAVVRRFLRNGDIMRMALPNPRRCNLNKARFGAQLFDGLRAAIAHAGPQPTHELIHKTAEWSFKWHPSLDSFGDKLARNTFAALAI